LRSLFALVPAFVWLVATSDASAISVVVHLHFENFGASGQQPGEADLVGWKVELTTPAGAPVANLANTQGNGDTLPFEVPAGAYVAVLTLPTPDPYDDDAFWPTNLQFPFTMEATNPQGQPITSYRLRIGLGCGCNDGDACTTDICTAGICTTKPNLKPELPELCDAADNDCDGVTDEGLPVPCNGNPPVVIGCADGTREGFLDFATYPTLATCGGAWDQPGLDGAARAPSCGRVAGNHSTNKPGTGCRAADLCAPGWHVCRGPADLAARRGSCSDAVDPFYPNFGNGDFGNGTQGILAPYPGGAFFVARGVSAATCVDAVNGVPPGGSGIFGCGNLGLANTRCGGFTRAAGTNCGGLRNQSVAPGDDPAIDWAYDLEGDWAWSCGGAGGTERDRLTKRFPDRQGGVLCCRDSAPGLPEVCDGIDNDADGTTDEFPDGRAGESCPLGALCGTFECTASGGLMCQDPGVCDDTSCNGVDDDNDGATDEEYTVVDTTCGVGACASTGSRTCDAGDEVDSCLAEPKAEPNDVTCDGVDGDCDGLTDEDWLDLPSTCGFGACASTGTRKCQDGVPLNTCVPKPPLMTVDDNCNGIDEDCSGSADDDWVVRPQTCGVGACAAVGAFECLASVPTNTCVPKPPLAATDDTCNGVDNDCDGTADEEFVPHAITCGQGACIATGTAICDRGEPSDDCVPLPATDDEDAACDGIDFDCDGTTDEDFVGMTITCGEGTCMRSGTLACVAGDAVESCEPGTGADADAVCDGQDEDCDGATDEDYEPIATTCGTGLCDGNSGAAACTSGVVVDACDPLAGAQSETCDGVDEDCDGDTDENFGAVGAPCDGDDGDACATGILTCTRDGRAATCSETGPAKVDVCNGRDDDCDGATDEGILECGDRDDDGVPDPIDNCVGAANADQADRDDDGTGDVCDLLAQGAGGDCSSGGAGTGLGLVLALLVVLRAARSPGFAILAKALRARA